MTRTLPIAWRNLRQYRGRLTPLVLVTVLGCLLALLAAGLVGRAAERTRTGIAEGQALRTIELRAAPERADTLALTSGNLDKLGGVENLGAIEPSLQAAFGIKTDSVPGVLLYATVPQDSRRPPIVAGTRPELFPLRDNEVVLPARVQGADLTALLGSRVEVTATRQVAAGQGVPLTEEVQVAGLYDPGYAEDGPSAAYADPALVVRLAAAKAGVPAADFLSRQGYSSATVLARQADQVPAALTRIRALGFSATSLASRLSELPAALELLSVFAYVVLALLLVFSLLSGLTLAGSFVRGRTREIGVLKAIGFARRRILALLLTELAIAGLLAGTVGVLLGNLAVAAAAGLGGRTLFGVTLPPGTGLPSPLWTLGLLFGPALAMLLGALRPAIRAAALPPERALREW
ncbi:ABC transporter permease [Crossiella sp. CA198]|uniref:ABC transporter permease n=1 Tax=Crossiella sp. CA198 TaxID=3455607 RepID=UPI003F8D555D